MMTEEIYTRALALAGELEETERSLLKLLCGAAAAMLEARLREDVHLEDCQEVFCNAACLYALAGLKDSGGAPEVEEFKAGDLTVRQGSRLSGAGKGLRSQAAALIRPYLRDSFAFLGV